MRAARTLRRGTRYRVWSFAPRPTPRALAWSPARYPRAATRFLQLGQARLPGYGVAGRERTVDRLFTEDRTRRASAVPAAVGRGRSRRTARSRSPYEATLLLERWLRRDGGFRYEEQPPAGRRASAGRLRAGEPRGLLPALRGGDGPDAPHGRDPGPRSGRLHGGQLGGRCVDGHRPAGSRLGGSMVRRPRVARLRSDAGARDALRRVHARFQLGRRGRRARHGEVPRLCARGPGLGWHRCKPGGSSKRATGCRGGWRRCSWFQGCSSRQAPPCRSPNMLAVSDGCAAATPVRSLRGFAPSSWPCSPTAARRSDATSPSPSSSG